MILNPIIILADILRLISIVHLRIFPLAGEFGSMVKFSTLAGDDGLAAEEKLKFNPYTD